jgi:hypothetical protein
VTYTGGEAAKADVNLLTPDTVDFDVYWVTPQAQTEGDAKEVPGGRKFFYGKFRGTFELVTEAFTIANFVTKEDALTDVLNNNYTWLEIIEYATDLHTTNKLIPVVISGYDVNSVAGLKQFKIKLENSFVKP